MLQSCENRRSTVSRAARVLFMVGALGCLLSVPIMAQSIAAAEAADVAMATDSVGTEALEGLWAGQILYAPAEIELDFWVEFGLDADGKLVGNIDVPSQKMQFYPLTVIEQEGRRVDFDFHRDSERTMNAHFFFRGELSEDGKVQKGIFKGWKDDDGNNRVPYELKKVESAFGERPEPQYQAVTSFTGRGAEVREAFNKDVDHVRVVLLLSPT